MNRALIPTLLTLAAAGVGAQQAVIDQAQGFARAFVAYAPGSDVEMRLDHTGATSAGSYLALTAVRTVPGETDGDQMGMLVDPGAHTVAIGLIVPLSPGTPPPSWNNLPRFAEQTLAGWLTEMMGTRVRVNWPAVPSRPAPVIALTAETSTGYGWSRLPVAFSADVRYLVIGDTWPLDRDPRAVRRELLQGPEVQWDPGHENAVVKVVEFSDFQCPACKRGWGEMKPLLTSFGEKVRHGMVNFPLVHSHPWAFRAAVAGACIARFWPDRLLSFKEELYRMQDALSVTSVDEATFGFLEQSDLDETKFRSCYLKDPAIDAVLQQVNLAQRLGVLGTPTYFVNGEPLPYRHKEWAEKRVQVIIDAGGLPERAAEIAYSPPPSPTATPSASGR